MAGERYWTLLCLTLGPFSVAYFHKRNLAFRGINFFFLTKLGGTKRS